jgi:hypothetical protein
MPCDDVNDEEYPDPEVIELLAGYRGLTDAQRRQFRRALLSPAQAAGLGLRAWRARKRNERIAVLVGPWEAAGVPLAKWDWAQVRVVADPDHAIKLTSLRRSYRRWRRHQSRTMNPSSTLPLWGGVERSAPAAAE